MADIGKLNIVIGATTTGLTAGLKAAQSGLNGLGRMSASLLKPLKNVTAAIGTNGLSGALIAIPGPMGVAAVAADSMRKQLVSASIAAAKAQLEFDAMGDKIDASANSMRRLGLIERSTGAAGLTGAAGSVRGLIGRAAAGVESDAAVLRQLGVNARELQTLAVDEQLQQISAALNSIGDSGQRAAMGFRIFGSQYSSIRRAMESGSLSGSGATQLSVRQETNLRQLNESTERLAEAWSDLGTQILANLAPSLTEFANRTRIAIEALIDFERRSQGISTATAWTWDQLINLTPAGPAYNAVNGFLTAVNGVNTPAGGGGGGGSHPGLEEYLQQQQGIAAANQELNRLQAELDTFNDSLRRQNQVAREVDPVTRGLIDAQQRYGRALDRSRQTQLEYNLRLQQAIRLEQQFTAPLTGFGRSMRQINDLFSRGMLSPGAAGRAAVSAFESIASQVPNVNQNQLPQQLQEGTAAAMSATNAAIREASVRAEDPQERVRRVLEGMAELQRQQTEYNRRIYEALRQQQVQAAQF